MKRTKIIATIGPATATKQTIAQLKNAGANAYRINMSHGDVDQWNELVSLIRSVTTEHPIFLDTRGPEIRLMGVEGTHHLASGDEFVLSIHKHKTLPYLSTPARLRKGMRMVLDDGNIEAQVKGVEDGIATITITQPATLTNRRKVSVPHTQDDLPILTSQDKNDLKKAKELDIDGYAVSFTRTKKDLQAVRKIVGKNAFLIAKIENQEGVDNIDEIIEEANAIMVARGDLGVEIPLEEVPFVQKTIIKKCNFAAKPVIVATQMLSSMRTRNRPSRAEASDVANAILDGADCCMLSDETAMGEYPIETVQTMANIAKTIEPKVENVVELKEHVSRISESISNAAYTISTTLSVDALITSTSTGFTARMITRHRPKIPVIAVTHHAHVARELHFSWGVEPIRFLNLPEGNRLIYCSVRAAHEHKLIDKKDLVCVTAGVEVLKSQQTNLLEIHRVNDLFAYHKIK